jgi:hypothetical protein
VVASREMAIVQPRAPRHILYIVSALLAPAAVALAIAGCTEPDGSDRAEQDPATAQAPQVSSAVETAPAPLPQQPASAQNAPAPARSPAPPSVPPSASETEPSGFHLDDPEIEYEIPRRTARPRKGRTVQLVLRSSPPGAVAAVDGVALGPTPALWEGVVDSTPREFTFVLAGYAIARYRFVPMRSGIVHGTLEPIETEGEDGAREQGKRGRPQRPSPAQ